MHEHHVEDTLSVTLVSIPSRSPLRGNVSRLVVVVKMLCRMVSLLRDAVGAKNLIRI